MSEAERGSYASECLRLLRDQLHRLEVFSKLLEDAPVVEILDATLKRELDAIIGTKEEGLMSVGAPLGIYLMMGPLPSEADEKVSGIELARIRYQAEVLSVLFTGNESGANAHIDLDSATANLDELQAAGERLRRRVTELVSHEDILLLAKDAEKRAHSL